MGVWVDPGPSWHALHQKRAKEVPQPVIAQCKANISTQSAETIAVTERKAGPSLSNSYVCLQQLCMSMYRYMRSGLTADVARMILPNCSFELCPFGLFIPLAYLLPALGGSCWRDANLCCWRMTRNRLNACAQMNGSTYAVSDS